MRKIALAAVATALLSGTGWAQAPAGTPPVRIGAPVATTTELPLPPPRAGESPPPPPLAFGVDGPTGVIVSPPGGLTPTPSLLPGVRPPMPVDGPPIEIPPGPHVWAGLEYLLWRSKGGLLPALITDVYATTPQPAAAYPLSDDRINGDLNSGLRLTAGYWLDKPNGTGVEARYSAFLHADDVATYAGPPANILSRPFWDALNDRPALLQLSTSNGSTTGVAQVRTSFDSWGLEGNYFRRGPAMFSEIFHWVLGARYWSLEENLGVEAGSQTGGFRVGSIDTFNTRNQYFGAQVGGLWQWTRNGMIIDLRLVFSAGAMHEQVNIQGGSTAILPTGAQVNRPGGFLALSSNIGEYSRTKLAFVRDLSLGVTYCVTDNVRLRVAYEGTLVSCVVRPGEQIDLNINPTYLPFSATAPTGPAQPGFRFNDEMFWMHGIVLGLTVQF